MQRSLLHMGNKRVHMPRQMGGLNPIETTDHFKCTYVSTSIKYLVELVNHASARWCVGQRACNIHLLKKGATSNILKLFCCDFFSC
jgi:hypothetical protein